MREKAERDGRRVTQRNIAEASGVSVNTVQGWKNGAIPEYPTVEKVAAYFGVSTDRLSTGGAKAGGESRVVVDDELLTETRAIVEQYLASAIGRDTPVAIRDKLVSATELAFRQVGFSRERALRVVDHARQMLEAGYVEKRSELE
jgi:transcriptional regulator with XRE-family HTH domain